jgi:hypothetical protein
MFQKFLTVLYIVVLLGVATGVAEAQKNFRPGYILLLSGDTLRGEVDARGGHRMAFLCTFRPTASAPQVQYAPEALKGYGLNGGARYESCLLPSTANTPLLLFLQVLAQGSAMLYTYNDAASHTRYFFRKGSSGAVTELVQTIQNVRNASGMVEERAYPFRQVLSQAFADCFAVQPLLPKAELTDSKLVAIFDRYNTCSQSSPAIRPSLVRKATVHFGLLAGVQQASATLDDIGEVPLTSDLRSVAGVGLLFHPATFNSKLAFRLEALYQAQLLKGNYLRTNVGGASLISNREADIMLKTLRVPLMLRYNLLLGRVQPYLQAGAVVAVLLDRQRARIIETSRALSGVGTTTNVRQIEMRSLGIGPVGALGVLVPLEKHSVQLEARYDRLDSASEVVTLLSGSQTISFLLGYNF